MVDGLGAQGGSRHDALLDLTSCVNPYGPPPAVVDALHAASADLVARHPYEAEGRMQVRYAAHMKADPALVTVDRGVSGLIWKLAQSIPGHAVSIPMPGYTEFLRAFPRSQLVSSTGPSHTAAQLTTALRTRPVCIISNPHNPSGDVLPTALLVELATAHRSSILIVDESYMDFRMEPGAESLVGQGLDNVVVLRSPTKFYGIAGIRIGAAWTRNAPMRGLLESGRGTWPVSGLEVFLAGVAMDQLRWAATTRQQLRDDRDWLYSRLAGQGCSMAKGDMHYSLVVNDPTNLRSRLADAGIAVRDLGPAHGLPVPCFRISAPRIDDRALLPQ